MRSIKNLVAALAVAACTGWAATPVLAQSDAASFPNKPVRLIVPFAAGGASDGIARVLGTKLGELWKQSVIVENRGGASGAIGTMLVVKAPPDGYTVLLGGPATLSGPPALNPNVPYDNLKDFEHVSIVATFPSALVVHPSIAKTLPELIALLKANPGKYTYASSGNGTSTHLIAELFKWMTGTNILHVPYKGTGPGLADLVSGEVAMTIAPINAVTSHVKAGRLRALGVTGAKRSPEFPGVPTIGELVPKFEADSWICVSAPAGTPRAIVDRMSADIRKVVQDPDTVAKFRELTLNPVGSTPEELVKIVREDTERWRQVARVAGIKAD
jgi:tripartite-type tricarboxylate transporter receptor subunit TctC